MKQAAQLPHNRFQKVVFTTIYLVVCGVSAAAEPTLTSAVAEASKAADLGPISPCYDSQHICCAIYAPTSAYTQVLLLSWLVEKGPEAERLELVSRCYGANNACELVCALPSAFAGAAAELALTARAVKGAEAEKLGLVSRCYDSRQQLMAAVVELAAGIAAKSPLAVAGTKSTLLHTR
jgi:hypothetical protein